MVIDMCMNTLLNLPWVSFGDKDFQRCNADIWGYVSLWPSVLVHPYLLSLRFERCWLLTQQWIPGSQKEMAHRAEPWFLDACQVLQFSILALSLNSNADFQLYFGF